MSKLKVDEIRSADRSVSSSANITLTDDGNIKIPDGGTIGSASDADAISISSAGYVIDSARPHFVVDGTGSGSVSVAQGARVPFNEKVRDHGNNFDIGTNNWFFLTPIAGVYMFHVQIYTYHATVVTYDFRLFSHDTSNSNGVGLARVRDGRNSGSGQHISMSAISYLAANRRISVYNEVGGDRSIYFGDYAHSSFSGCLIG